MTKRMLFMLCAGLIVVLMAACTGDKQQSSGAADAIPSENAASTAPEVQTKLSEDDMNPSRTDDVGLPTMSAEYQVVYDQYIHPYIPGDFFLRNFNANDTTRLFASRMYSCIAKPTEFVEIPQDIVEQEVAKLFLFPIPVEDMRSASVYDYEEEKGVYLVPEYHHSNHLRGVITNLIQSNHTLIILCDWYTTEYTDEPAGTYKYYTTAEIVIDKNTGAYIRNIVNAR